MEQSQVPTGFAMMLARNNAAMDAFAGMDSAAKQTVLEKARNARSQRDMEQIVYTLANSPL